MKKTINKNKKTLKKTTKTIVNAKTKPKAKVKHKTKVKAKAKPKAKPKAKANKANTKAKVVVKPNAKVKVKSVAKSNAVKKVKKSDAKVEKATEAKVPRVAKNLAARIAKLTLRRAKKSSGPSDIRPYESKRDEEYMSREQEQHFRGVLLKWKSQLMEEVDRTMHNMQDKQSNYPDPVDRASQEEEFSLELRARDRERKLLGKIEETLNRINEHDYGYCDDCGAEIGIKRFEARPTAMQCIECKTIAEIREKQIGEGGGGGSGSN